MNQIPIRYSSKATLQVIRGELPHVWFTTKGLLRRLYWLWDNPEYDKPTYDALYATLQLLVSKGTLERRSGYKAIEYRLIEGQDSNDERRN